MDDNKRDDDILNNNEDHSDALEFEASEGGMPDGVEQPADTDGVEDILLHVVNDENLEPSADSGQKQPGVSVSAVMAEDVIDTSVKKPADTPAKSKATPKAKRSESKRDENKLTSWFKEIKAEFSKIIWPNKTELGKMTVTVIVTSLLIGTLIAGLDFVFNFAVGLLIDLL